MFKVHIAGRGIIQPTSTVNVSEDGLHIHIDDEARPEFWMSVGIDRDTLLNLAALVTAAVAADVEDKK